MGAEAHGKLSEYINQLNKNTVLIEIGSGGDSTSTLRNISKQNDFTFFSVDINSTRTNESIDVIIEFGEKFLEDYQKWIYPNKYKISAAYLDNFDWMWQPFEYKTSKTPAWQHKQFLEYQEAGILLSNVNSQKAHLIQSMLIDKHSDEKCIILYDDTWFDDNIGTYVGKGGTSIIYLLTKGWEILPFTPDGLEQPEMAVMIGKNIIPNTQPQLI